jgi:hypothetical protein
MVFFSTNNEEVGSNHSEEFSDEDEANETNGNYLSRYTNEGRGVLGTWNCIFAAHCFRFGSGFEKVSVSGSRRAKNDSQ